MEANPFHAMKKLIIFLFTVLLSFHAYGQAIQPLNLPAAATVATGTVNYTPDSSTYVQVSKFINTSKPVVRITWDGASAGSSTVTITILTSRDGIVWDSATDSLFNLQATVSGGAFSTSDIFNLAGVNYIAIGRILNGSGSNITSQTCKIIFNP